MSLDQSLANQCGAKEGRERDKRMATNHTGQVKQWIWNRGEQQNPNKTGTNDQFFNLELPSFQKGLKII